MGLFSWLPSQFFPDGKTTDFCLLILCPATLLKVLMMSKSFLVEFLGSSKEESNLKPIKNIVSSANRNNLTYSFPIWIYFISSS
jgi:hypothetical protein